MPAGNPLFLTNNYVYMINLLFESGITVVIFFIDERNLKKFGLTAELIILHENFFFSKTFINSKNW